MARPSSSRPVRVSPAFQQLSPPLIIVGMHRSGTSLVSGMLSLMGVQMYPHGLPRSEGSRVILPSPNERMNGYAEAEPFFLVNEKILVRAQATWDFIDPFLKLRDEPKFADASVEVLESATFGILKREFVDAFDGGIHGLWGWKDPRNSLTLGYWLELFPEARVVHVVRGAAEVTDSLQKRAAAWREEGLVGRPPSIGARALRLARDPQALARAVGKRTGLYHPVDRPKVTVEDTAYCMRLWDQYVNSCRGFKWLGPRFMEVKYEDVVSEFRFPGISNGGVCRHLSFGFSNSVRRGSGRSAQTASPSSVFRRAPQSAISKTGPVTRVTSATLKPNRPEPPEEKGKLRTG